MKYCSECGAPVHLEPRRQNGIVRFVCKACHRVFYQTPKLAAACIASWEGSILLCCRSVEPERGLWELPAGFVSAGETAGEAAARETLEEANVEVEIERPYALLHIAQGNQIRLVYLARLRSSEFRRGPETLDVRLFREDEIPWEKLAFASTRDTLRRYFADRKSGLIGFFFAEIAPVSFSP